MDLGEVMRGFNVDLVSDVQDHEYVMIDVFDVNRDKERREHFFDKLIT